MYVCYMLFNKYSKYTVLRFLLGIVEANLRKLSQSGLTILHVNRRPTKEKPCVVREVFCKLDAGRGSVVTFALS